MRTPLPVLVAALVAVVAGVATLHITVPAKPTSIFINASTLASGQNITLHLDYMPMNITVKTPNVISALCVYFHGMVVDSYNTVWLNIYENNYPGYSIISDNIFIDAKMEDTNVTILFIAGQNGCSSPAAVH